MTVNSATDIARAVRQGDVEPAAVLREHCRRHDETHGRLHALIQPRHDAAATELQLLDREGALAGVPVSIKECFAVRGLRTTLGIPSRRNLIDETDAPIVSGLRARGAVIIGKSNVPQAMYLHETTNPVWGQTNHPDDIRRGPGGSSGGDAALVAAGVVPLAVGNDLAGSVRQPAHACGIPAFLPASSQLGNAGGFNTLPNFDLIGSRAGFLARSVADLELAATAFGVLPAASTSAALPKRIALWPEAGLLPPAASVRRGVAEAAAILRSAGHQVDDVDDRLAAEAAWLLFALLSADGGADIRELFASDQPMPTVARLLRIAGLPRAARPPLAALLGLLGNRTEAAALRATGPRSATGWEALLDQHQHFLEQVERLRSQYDAVLCPVSSLPALRHGTAARLVAAAAPCLLANLADLSAGVVPVTRVAATEERTRSWSPDRVLRAAAATERHSAGLPIGVQIVGLAKGPAAERVVLDLLATIERGSDFSRLARR